MRCTVGEASHVNLTNAKEPHGSSSDVGVILLCFHCCFCYPLMKSVFPESPGPHMYSITSTLYPPVIHLNLMKQIKTVTISSLSRELRKNNLDVNYYCCQCCFPLMMLFPPQFAVGKLFQSWLIASGKGPDFLYRPKSQSLSLEV